MTLKRKLIVMIIALVLLAGALALLVPGVILPALRYRQAISDSREGKYDEALTLLTELGDYRDAADYIPGTTYMKAEQLRTSGSPEEAETLFASVSYLDSDRKVLQCRADALYNAGAYGEAWTIYDSLADAYHTHDYDYEILMKEAAALAEAGSTEEAAAAYEALGDYADAADLARSLRYGQAETLRTSGKPEEAETLFAALDGYGDSAARVLQCRADALYLQGDYTGADEQYAALPAEYRTYARELDDLLAQGEALETAGEYDAAIALYVSLGDFRDAKDRIIPARRAKADALYAAGDLENAGALYAQLGESDLVLRCSADILYNEGKYEQAWALYNELPEDLRTHKTDADRAETLRQAGSYEEAERLFRVMGENDRAEQCRADALYDAGDLAGAYLLYSELPEELQTHYDDYDAMMVEAEEDAEQGLYDEAIALFTRLGTYEDAAERIRPTRLAKAEALRRAGSYDEAEQLYTELGETEHLTQCAADRLYD